MTLTSIQTVTSVTASMLAPYTQYRCTVSSVLGNYNNSVTVNKATKQDGESDLVVQNSPPHPRFKTTPEIKTTILKSHLLDFLFI